jgi:hypothetical protein
MSNNRYKKILIYIIPFILGFCGIIIVQLLLVQKGKTPWFIVCKIQQPYLFKTTGAMITYYYALPNKKKVTKEDIGLVVKSINKHSYELSEIYIVSPKFLLIPSNNKKIRGIYISARIFSKDNKNVSYDVARKYWVQFTKKQIKNTLGGVK